MQEPPAWFNPVLQYPPMPTPPRAPPNRTPFDTAPEGKNLQKKKSATKHDKWLRPNPEQIVYLEDRVRRQFFKDHPYEAFRSRTLVEPGLELEEPHPIQREAWSRLVQHGRNPSPDE